MIIRGENLAMFGQVGGDYPLTEVPLDVILRRQADAVELDARHAKGVSVDLGFLDDM